MFKIFLFLSILSSNAFAQNNLEFNKRFIECEDEWVVFLPQEDSTFGFGFIYIDAEAGLTYNSEGTFKVGSNGIYDVEKLEGTSLKVRLTPNNVKVAVIPSSLYDKLEIKKTPDWLANYKKDINTAKRQYNWGFMYNGWNECERALPFLLKAKELDSNYSGLAVEIAYSYNCLEKYDKAIEVLEIEILKHPTDAYINKEFIYSITKTDKIELATIQYHNSIDKLSESTYNAENCFNIMQYFYIKKDKKNFTAWYKELGKWPISNKKIREYADIMKKELK